MIFKLDFSDIMSAATTLIFVTQISQITPIPFVVDEPACHRQSSIFARQVKKIL